MTVYRVITETFIEADGEHEAELKVNDKKNKWELIDVHEYQKEIPSKEIQEEEIEKYGDVNQGLGTWNGYEYIKNK